MMTFCPIKRHNNNKLPKYLAVREKKCIFAPELLKQNLLTNKKRTSMKKIFTLIAMATIAMSANAQELWSAEDLDVDVLNATSTPNSNPKLKKVTAVYDADPGSDAVLAEANTEQNTLQDFFFEAKTTSITLRGISTPNADAKEGEAWRCRQQHGFGHRPLQPEVYQLCEAQGRKPRHRVSRVFLPE
jgi:hypothetical protein